MRNGVAFGERRERGRTARLALCAALASCAAIQGQTALAQEESGDWDITLGVGAAFGPAYQGSDEMDVTPFPFIDITWRDRLFLNNSHGFGVFLLNPDDVGALGGSTVEKVRLGVSVRPSESRDESASDHLRGMGDVDLSAEVGAFASAEIGFVALDAEVFFNPDGGHEGVTGEIGVSRSFALGRRARIGVRPFVKLGDATYAEQFFGVSAEQAARSGLAAYDAGSAYYAGGVEVNGHVSLYGRWGLAGFARYQHLLGDVADSPLVEQEGGVTVGSALIYDF